LFSPMQTTIEPLRLSEENLTTTEDDCHLHRGRPFTGVSERWQGDRLVSEVTCVNGLRHGRTRTWHPEEGHLVLDLNYVGNELHGVGVEWFSDDRRRRLIRYEHGICVQSVEWDEQGGIVSVHGARTADGLCSVVQSLRKLRDTGRGLPPEDEIRQAALGDELEHILANLA